MLRYLKQCYCMFSPSITEKLANLIRSGRHYEVRKGEVLLSTEDEKDVHLVIKGYIKRYQITNAGSVSVQSIYGAHEIFPLTNVFKIVFDKDIYNGPDTFYYEAMSNSKLAKIDKATLKQAIDNDPLLYKDLLGVSSERIQSNLQQLENLSLSVYYHRVAHQLWYFANKYSEKNGQTAKLKIPLTHQDIADILSTTRETVSVCMSKLNKEGLIKSGRYIVIPDIEKLKKAAYS